MSTSFDSRARADGQTKTRFLYEHVCRLAQQGRANTICEVGFNAGLSALLLLEAAPSARVISFDLGDMPWSGFAANALRAAYDSPRRFIGTVFGDSAATLPFFKDGPCDVM